MKRILVVEDERSISLVVKAYLTKAGYEVETAFQGEQAMASFTEWEPSLVILDVMLPDIDGWTILKWIRERSACPVIMLTALGDPRDRVDGLNGGADDYLTKPFVGEELVARVAAVLRRQPQWETEDVLIAGTLRIDFVAREVRLRGKKVHLTPRDLALLLFLAEHPNRCFSREQLIENVWGIDFEGSDRAVDLAVKRVRQALADWPKEEGEIATLRRMGYQFCVHTRT